MVSTHFTDSLQILYLGHYCAYLSSLINQSRNFFMTQCQGNGWISDDFHFPGKNLSGKTDLSIDLSLMIVTVDAQQEAFQFDQVKIKISLIFISIFWQRSNFLLLNTSM